MTAFTRPSVRALYPLGITFSMLVLAYSLNSVVEALLLRQMPVRYAPAPSQPARPLHPQRLASCLGLPTSVRREFQIIRRRGPTLFEVSSSSGPQRDEVGSACEDSGIRITPLLRDGKLQGYRLGFTRPGTLAAQLGLEEQDILRSINGMALDSPEHALEIYSRLKDAALIELLLEREGRALRHTYVIRR